MTKYLAWLIILSMLLPAYTYAAESKQKKEKKEIEVRADNNCSQPCIALGKVSVTKYTAFSSCSEKFKKTAAKKYGADAILGYKQMPGRGPDNALWGEAGYFCEGIAVRWAKEGENGITKITDETPVPILK